MQEVFEKIIKKLEEYEYENFADRDSTPSKHCKDVVDCEEMNCLLCVFDKAIEIVKQEAEQYNNGWIPCGEQLPEPIRPVLVTLRNWMNDRYFVRVGRFHTDHWRTDEGIVENSVVIAWKPLPEPYQPKGE